MKLITAVVRPDGLDTVMDAVLQAGARGLTATEVHGFGQQYGHLGGKPADKKALALPKLRIEILVTDDSVDAVTEAIAKAIDTGTIGAGKIWICPVEGVIRVRTGERDEDAI